MKRRLHTYSEIVTQPRVDDNSADNAGPALSNRLTQHYVSSLTRGQTRPR